MPKKELLNAPALKTTTSTVSIDPNVNHFSGENRTRQTAPVTGDDSDTLATIAAWLNIVEPHNTVE